MTQHWSNDKIHKLCQHTHVLHQLWFRSFQIVSPLPTTLFIFFKRWIIDPITGLIVKNYDLIKFTTDQFELPNTGNMDSSYTITGIIAHDGDIQHGHYWSYFRGHKNQQLWTKLDDDKIPVNHSLQKATTDIYGLFAEKNNK